MKRLLGVLTVLVLAGCASAGERAADVRKYTTDAYVYLGIGVLVDTGLFKGVTPTPSPRAT